MEDAGIALMADRQDAYPTEDAIPRIAKDYSSTEELLASDWFLSWSIRKLTARP